MTYTPGPGGYTTPSQQPPVMPGRTWPQAMAERAQAASPPPMPAAPPTNKRGPLPWLIGALVVAVLGVAGLITALALDGGGNEQPASSVAPSASAAVPAADEYDVAPRLVGALNQAGIDCLNWEETENPLSAVGLGSCYVGTEEIVVAIHRSRAEAADEPTRKAALLKGVSDVHIVVGGNWTLSCDSVDLCTRIERDFGGSYVYMPA